MKSKSLKMIIVIMLLITLNMANFLFVGSSFISSYALGDVSTNHKNVEFDAYFKTVEGEEVAVLEKEINEEQTFLYLKVNVKNEGYFNGEIALENSNFVLKSSESEYVSNIENNKIYLNQIHVGMSEEIRVEIEPIVEEKFEIGLLDMTSKIKINGIYRDSKQKDIDIKAERELKLALIENNTTENMMNEMKVITNKILEIDGEEKRVIQFAYYMGLKENNYPVKEINSKIILPAIEGKQAELSEVVYLNNMKSFEYNYDGSNIDITLKNEQNDEGKALFKKQGNESVILTCVYDKEAELKDMKISAEEKITFYDSKEINAKNEITIGEEELDSIVEVNARNSEDTIYKGKIYFGMDRQYTSTTQLKVNFIKPISNILISENSTQYIIGEEQQDASVTYVQTVIEKEQFDKILGTNGVLEIYDQNGNKLETITNATEIDKNGNIIVNYKEKEVKEIKIQTSAPVEEGILELNHVKTIQANGEVVKSASELKNKVIAQYNYDKEEKAGIEKETETSIKLENTTTKANLEVNKENLSTVIANNVEIKAVLVTNNEKYDLYKNPEVIIELPEQVEKISIESIDLLYENELKIRDYNVDGRIINVYLEGEQTQYKEETIQGSTIVINATVEVNRKSTTRDTEIKMIYKNEKAVMYEDGDIGMTSKGIRIVAPTDMTTIHSVKALEIETLGQEQTKQVLIQRGTEEKQLEAEIEIINNNENSTENIRILGDFPTNNSINNMGIELTTGIILEGIDNAKIYYSSNENATDEIDNAENEWKENIAEVSGVCKYLIIVEKLEAQNSVKGTYQYKIPSNLEYNQVAKMGYKVKYIDSATKVESELTATTIEMQTGIGPKLEAKLVSTVVNEGNSVVRNGEVIKYKIEVSNIGTEDVTNVKVTAKVPEGTTMVVPEEKYEYTGASYYEELDNKFYEETIEVLKVGEVVVKEYEVRVNKQLEKGTTLTNTAEIRYGDVVKQSNEIKYTTDLGNISVVVKRITDRTVDLYTSGVVQYFAMIENISNKKQENVKVKTNLPEILEVERLTLIKGMGKEEGEIYEISSTQENPVINEDFEEITENVESETLEYKEEIEIGSLEPGEIKVLSYDMAINKVQDGNNKIEFSVMVKNGKELYQSNSRQDNVEKIDVGISMTTSTEGQHVKDGDIIEYIIKVENKSNAQTTGLVLKDNIPTQLSVNSITENGQAIEGIEGNNIELPLTIEANSISTIVISTVVDYVEERDSAEAITNIATAEIYGENVATTSEISHIIQANTVNSEEENGGSNGNGEGNTEIPGSNNIENNDIAKGNKTISGVAWYDENENGQRDQGEKLLSNIKVRLLNTQTNNLVKTEDGKVLEALTNENGIYILDKVANGQYIVVFEYDNVQYTLTKYKVDGVSEEANSNAVLNELSIENETKQVASTDILEVKDNNISNIDIGFVKLKNFDLKLDKYVSKILIQDSNGTTVREYSDATMAKVELDAKRINGATVIIEYKINVTNNGEVEGYAKKIADYAPTDLKFSSELNRQWYQVGDTLYTESLSNEKIKAGETKTLTLVLTKSMTENNTGLIPNTAEIVEDYNELGIVDSNSVPGNRAKDENDLGIAEVLLSIRTGGIVYITIAIVIIAILGIVAVIIVKNRKMKKEQ